MYGPLRSKQGCWTCRLRRKKCDERHPICSTCESLTITCYGYGSKPDWMDNGEEEKAMASSIKQIVKHTSRGKGRLGVSLSKIQGYYNHQKTKSQGPRLESKSTGALPERFPRYGPDPNIESQGAAREKISPEQSTKTDKSPLTGPISEGGNSSLASGFLPAISSSEAVLLMHFLDNVFSLQYPMYRPGITQGGRGWLLSLLLRTKPLYHAALGLSAYHLGTLILSEPGNTGHILSLVEQEKHRAICLKEFLQAIKNVGQWVEKACEKNNLGVMASIVQLVFFELFTGHGDTWQVHLRAATNFLREGYRDQSALFITLLKSTNTSFLLDAALVEPESPASEEVVTFRFLCGVVIWLDIISCITTGTSPRLLSLHSHILSPDTEIKLENIMGCKNWVMLQIGRIAALHEYKTLALQQGHLDTAEFESSAENIKRELQGGLTEDSLTFSRISESDFPTPHVPPTTIVTRIFALAASIYLHTVTSGLLSEAECLNAFVREAMMIIRTIMPVNLMHALVWPLYIIGSFARREDEEFFRNIFTSAPLLDPSLEHRSKILPLLEMTWRMRGTDLSEWTWENSVRSLSYSLLLL